MMTFNLAHCKLTFLSVDYTSLVEMRLNLVMFLTQCLKGSKLIIEIYWS